MTQYIPFLINGIVLVIHNPYTLKRRYETQQQNKIRRKNNEREMFMHAITKRRIDKSQSEYESRSINRREYLDFMSVSMSSDWPYTNYIMQLMKESS